MKTTLLFFCKLQDASEKITPLDKARIDKWRRFAVKLQSSAPFALTLNEVQHIKTLPWVYVCTYIAVMLKHIRQAKLLRN